jgi:tetratricopeptide (TPR) repeat protein
MYCAQKQKKIIYSGHLRPFKWPLVLVAAMILGSCNSMTTLGGGDLSGAGANNLDASSTGRKLIADKNYTEANIYLNKMLMRNPHDGALHFLNGLSYHYQWVAGDESKKQLAEVGYESALRANPDNAAAAYGLALINVSDGKYSQASDYFARCLRLNPDSVPALRGLAVASYHARRPDLALAAADQLELITVPDDEIYRVKALSAAALHDQELASLSLGRIKSDDDRTYVGRRVGQWGDAYKVASLKDVPPPARPAPTSAPPNTELAISLQDAIAAQKAINSGAPIPSATPTGNAPVAAPAIIDGKPPQTAMVDLTIIQTEEDGQMISGVNLLDSLSATAQLSRGFLRSSDGSSFNLPNNSGSSIGGVMLGSGNTLAGAVTLASLNYSLNIANSNVTKNDVLARPTLTISDSRVSKFDAGYTLSIGLPAGLGGSGSLIDKKVGLHVEITPNFLADKQIVLNVVAGRSFFTPVETNAKGFSQSVEQSNVEMTATGVVKMGQTLVLSGLSERQLQSSRSQTPLLGDVPGVQYLFSNRVDTDITRTVMILVTPREVRSFDEEWSVSDKDSPEVRALKESDKRWFGIKNYPNYLSVMHHLVSNPLYQQFRTGDVLAETWHRPSQKEQRLNDIWTFVNY